MTFIPTPKKGELGGVCARMACNNQPATWFNCSTRQHYCPRCARRINALNCASICARVK